MQLKYSTGPPPRVNSPNVDVMVVGRDPIRERHHAARSIHRLSLLKNPPLYNPPNQSTNQSMMLRRRAKSLEKLELAARQDRNQERPRLALTSLRPLPPLSLRISSQPERSQWLLLRANRRYPTKSKIQMPRIPDPWMRLNLEIRLETTATVSQPSIITLHHNKARQIASLPGWINGIRTRTCR